MENLGQFDSPAIPGILFKAETAEADIYVTEMGLSLIFNGVVQNQPKAERAKDPVVHIYERIDLELQGARIRKDCIAKEQPGPETYNFFTPAHRNGLMGLKRYERITVKNVYPGVDWVLYSCNDGLKYDFIVHPSGDAHQIGMVYKSLRPLTLRNSELSIALERGEYLERSPFSYLSETKEEVKTGFEIKSQEQRTGLDTRFHETHVTFSVDSYDRSRTLVVDPFQLWWGTYFGGSRESYGMAIATDPSDHVFVAGSVSSLDMPVHPYGSLAYFQGTYSGAGNYAGPGDMFILKFTNTGQLLWATYFGGSMADELKDLKCDAAGNIFILGVTSTTNLPCKHPGGSAFVDSSLGTPSFDPDLFIAKFSNSGQYLWGTYYGGSKAEYPYTLTLDSQDNLYCTAYTTSTDVPCSNPGGGAFFQGTPSGPGSPIDALVIKFSNSGQRLLATYFGGSGTDMPFAACSDVNDNLYVSGYTTSHNFPVVNPGGGAYYQGSFPPTSNSMSGLIMKFNPNFQLVWSTYLGGSASDYVRAIGCDNAGNVFLSGNTTSANFPLLNPGSGAYFQSGPTTSPFLCKFNPQLQLVWSTRFGGGGERLLVGKCGEIYLTAACSNPSVAIPNTGHGAYIDAAYDPGSVNAPFDVFISCFTAAGTYLWGTYFGGKGNDLHLRFATDSRGDLFYTGQQVPSYAQPGMALSYTSCIVNPGNNAFFQPLALTSPTNASGASCIIGKFTGLASESTYTTSGCGNTNNAGIQVINGWGPYSYSWSTGSQTDSIAGVPQGSYSYTITDHYSGCLSSEAFYLGSPSLTLGIGSSSAQICKGGSAQFSASGANSFSWAPAQNLSASSGSVVNASPPVTTNFTVTGFNSPSCSADTVISLVVNQPPVIVITAEDSVCNGSTFSLAATGAQQYSWNPSPSFISVGNHSAIAKPTQDEVYTVVGKDGNNCLDSGQFKIKVIPLPDLNVAGSTTLCLGDTMVLTATGAERFHWEPGLSVGAPDSASTVLFPKADVTYTLTGTNGNTCRDSLTIPAAVFSAPKISIAAPDSVCSNLDFTVSASGAGDIAWQSAGYLSCMQCQNTKASITGTSKIYVTLTDANSCRNRDSVTVEVKMDCELNLIVPNIFTPNNDQANDYFKLSGKNITSLSCMIYSRWGDLVHSFESIEGFWNGDAVSGKGCADGVYFYVILLQDLYRKEHIYKGALQLIR